ncbi:hypothetical protein M378DRAFT_969473 [Amanita muscaria Koide BX008]|uniref:Uncharacterized protein n=1 Tax=Amanita muscaria (strain Koide BX008) TaxID=946122 RepID=A0A0C2WSV8_AMAMK|nr:hypothetical protein M378DRAFT_969473 [Amanita muscaria Koide BX008]
MQICASSLSVRGTIVLLIVRCYVPMLGVRVGGAFLDVLCIHGVRYLRWTCVSHFRKWCVFSFVSTLHRDTA